jgi:hypothetical protein
MTIILKRKRSKSLASMDFNGCPLSGTKSYNCHQICTPDQKGIGLCGRQAPHFFPDQKGKMGKI